MPTELTTELDLPLSEVDPLVTELLRLEADRQRHAVPLLAPSMIMPRAIRQALSSVVGDLDGEGYPGRWQCDLTSSVQEYLSKYATRGPRKYNPSGPFAEYLELEAARRIAAMFATEGRVDAEELHVNVQAASGSIANIAVLRALMEPGETLLSMGLSAGGHLSHGASFHETGQRYRVAHYGVSPDGTLNVASIAEAARSTRARVVIVGASSYPRKLPWSEIRRALDALSPRPYLVADIAHFVGLVASGHYPNPLPSADVVSFVGYKTLAGPRIGVCVTQHEEIARRIDRAVFPGIQSAPVMGAIAALAVAARRARSATHRRLMAIAIDHAHELCLTMSEHGIEPAFGGTETHLVLLRRPVAAQPTAGALERAGILLNSNMLPEDRQPSRARGLRIGMVGITQRGLARESLPVLAQLLSSQIRAAEDRSVPAEAGSPSCVRAFASEHLRTPAIFESGVL